MTATNQKTQRWYIEINDHNAGAIDIHANGFTAHTNDGEVECETWDEAKQAIEGSFASTNIASDA